MDSAFYAVFITALVLTIFMFLVIEDDLKRKSERVIYIMLLVIMAWPVSYSLLIAPSTITTYTLTCTATTGTALGSCPTPTQSIITQQETNTPLSAWAQGSYLLFVGGMSLITILLFIKYMVEYGLTLFLDGLKSIFKKKNRN